MFTPIPLHEAKIGHYILMPFGGSVSIIDCELSLNHIPKVTFTLQAAGMELPIVLEDMEEAMFYFQRN